RGGQTSAFPATGKRRESLSPPMYESNGIRQFRGPNRRSAAFAASLVSQQGRGGYPASAMPVVTSLMDCL
ncbi:MAG: hypothetical protein KJZ57_12350, partial [Anaerolineales bacterium]|nr:hypothetical protein [Anaerolineales bacterium]